MFFEFNKFLAEGTGKDLLLISSRGSSNHNFVISHLLIHAARNKKKVRLICCGESLQFYSVVCKRTGVSLEDMQSSGNFHPICLVSLWKDQISAGQLPTIPPEVVRDVHDSDLVIIDDLGALIDFSTASDAVKIVHSLKSLTPDMLAVGIRSEDPESERVLKLIRTMATMWAEAHPLDTGYSKEVHGVLDMRAFKPHRNGTVRKRMHYRVTERGTKLLIIGGNIAPVT